MTASLTVEALIDHLADELAQRLATRLTPPDGPNARQGRTCSSARLVSLDELVERLPRAKSPATWKRWLYERTRKGTVPGCYKLGGRLFFDPEQVEGWLITGDEAPGRRPEMSTGCAGERMAPSPIP